MPFLKCFAEAKHSFKSNYFNHLNILIFSKVSILALIFLLFFDAICYRNCSVYSVFEVFGYIAFRKDFFSFVLSIEVININVLGKKRK